MSLEALKRDGWSEFFRNEDPKCPHCGITCEISENELWSLYEEGDHEIKCPSCHEEFNVVTNVSYTFSTNEQEAIEDSEDDIEQTGASE